DEAAERIKTARRRPTLLPGALASQVLTDRLGVAAGVAADRSDRPTPRLQGVDLHVVLLCEHPPRVLLRSMASEPPTVRGTPDRTRAHAREATTARPYGPSPPSLPARRSTPYRGREFR